MRVRLGLCAIGALAAAAAACPDVPLAPIVTRPTPAPYLTFTLDTLTGSNLDVCCQWGGVTALLGADQSIHVLALDNWNGRLRYLGCANVCDKAAHWFDGTVDSGLFEYGVTFSGAALTADGFRAVYTAYPYGYYGPSIRYVHCPGACNFKGNWSETNLFLGRAALERWDWLGGHSTPLAADPAGGLHLLFNNPQGWSLTYAYCATGCDGQASWGELTVDSSVDRQTAELIAVAPDGRVHVLYGASAGLMHKTCPASCTIARNWQSEVVAGATIVEHLDALSLAFDPDGRLHLAYLDRTRFASYAACDAPCAAPGAWSVATLPLTTNDVSLATDGQGRLYLATTDHSVAVSRCSVGCSNPASWQTVTVDSALGSQHYDNLWLGAGRVSIAVDSAGRARVASSNGGWPQILQYTQMLQ